MSVNSEMTVAARDSFKLQEVETKKYGDLKKEKEIERRLRELGLWENKRHMERHLAEMLDSRIDQYDGLTKTLKKVRRKRDGSGSVSEIRNIICPKVIRDMYGQQIAYHVDVLMGCFTKDVTYHVTDNVVSISGTTPDAANKLTKDIQLELPKTVDISRLRVTYLAGVVKIRVPFQLHPIPNPTSPPPTSKFTPVSTLYSLQQRLRPLSLNTTLPGVTTDDPEINYGTPGNVVSCSSTSSYESSHIDSSASDDLDGRSDLSPSSPSQLTAEAFDLNVLLNPLGNKSSF